MSMVMADTFDAPMTDSGDVDVSMYPGGMATADSWLSAEASMGDVAFSADTATFDYMQEGIEIDMLDDNDEDEAITEYEMADDAYHGHELEDIEVLDVSRAPSLPPAGHIDVALDAAEDSEHMHIPPAESVAPVASDPHFPDEPVATDSAHSETNPAVYHPEHSTETGVLTASSAASESVVHSGVSSAVLDVSAAVEDNATYAGLPMASTLSHHEESTANDGHVGMAESHSLPEHHLPGPELADHPAVAHLPSSDQVDPIDLHPAGDSALELAGDAGDPHEISDGVYIDPPPPVLLSLPASAEDAECCLFNHPQPRASSSTSEGAKSDSPAESLHLLLHDRPTLYYEPLSSVFDALRHDEFIANLPGCAEAELVLDAYELQLAISEDNVYAHEVTIHELDVIHGGSDLRGPLRLKLKFVAPRFVTRYHLLRDQIARLNLTADGDELHSAVAASDPPHEQDDAVAEVPHETEDRAQDEGAYANPDEHGEGSTEVVEGEADGQFGEDAGGSAAEASAAQNGLTDTELDHHHDVAAEHQLEDGAPEAADKVDVAAPPDDGEVGGSEPVGEPDPELEEVADGEDNLDANELHEYADADEGGDYVEHDEFPDDEDEFGDDLPQELGGQTEDAAYTHTGAVEDGPEDAAYGEEGSAYAHEDVLASSSAELEQPEPVASLAQDDEDPHLHNNGLDASEHTDTSAHLDSAYDYDEYHLEDDTGGELHQHDKTSDPVPSASEETVQHPDQDNPANERSTTLSSDNEDGEDGFADDWDDEDDVLDAEPATEATQVEALSRKSSTTTLASKTSKRTYDEVELDDFDDDPSQLEAASSPDSKRPRVQ